MIRTFIAVNLTPELKRKIGEVAKDFDINGVKPVDSGLLHVTIKFLGPTEESKVDSIADALKKVTVKPFEAKFGSIGGFPNPRSPRVIWVHAEGNFEELNRQAEDLMSGLGFEREGRFSPHVTVARVKFQSQEQKDKLPGLFEKYKDFKPGNMEVNSIYLMKSILSPKGPKYEVLKEISLEP